MFLLSSIQDINTFNINVLKHSAIKFLQHSQKNIKFGSVSITINLKTPQNIQNKDVKHETSKINSNIILTDFQQFQMEITHKINYFVIIRTFPSCWKENFFSFLVFTEILNLKHAKFIKEFWKNKQRSRCVYKKIFFCVLQRENKTF